LNTLRRSVAGIVMPRFNDDGKRTLDKYNKTENSL